jgi:hypothetical protein
VPPANPFLLTGCRLLASPVDGKVCFFGSSNLTEPESESVFTYAVVDGSSNMGKPQPVVVINYNAQTCPVVAGYSDLAAPPSPAVKITLNGRNIHFEVTAAYVREQTSWCTSPRTMTTARCSYI